MIVEPFFFPCCACCGSQHLALFWSFLGRSGLHRSRSAQNGRDRRRLVNTNEKATFYLTRELANISGTKPKQCWDELRIHMKFLSETGNKITRPAKLILAVWGLGAPLVHAFGAQEVLKLMKRGRDIVKPTASLG